MNSDLARLRDVLTAAGGDPPTGRELAELLWLAAQSRPGPQPGREAPPLPAAGGTPVPPPFPPGRQPPPAQPGRPEPPVTYGYPGGAVGRGPQSPPGGQTPWGPQSPPSGQTPPDGPPPWDPQSPPGTQTPPSEQSPPGPQNPAPPVPRRERPRPTGAPPPAEPPRADHAEHASAPDPDADSETRSAETDHASYRLRPAGPSPATASPVAGNHADFDPPGETALYSRATVRIRDDRPAILAPTPPMISRPLALQRALRPLRGTAPPARPTEWDKDGTAHRMAALGAGRGRWLPRLWPAPERRLHLRLVVDSGPTMAMWQPLARDLHKAFGQLGAFRTVELVRLDADGSVAVRKWPAGRTVALVISDTMGPQWREGAAGQRWYRTLRGWARTLPVAVVQPLPERMWQDTPLTPVPGLFTAPGPGAPNASLHFAPYDGLARGIPVPVLEPNAEWFGNWAGLLASPGGTVFPGSAAQLTAGPPLASRDGEDGLAPRDTPAEELVQRFRSAASQQAVRLAAHLAVGLAYLPVMRIVQTSVEKQPRAQHLAEVVLSGLLTVAPGPAGSYEFRPGVRELLLATLPSHELGRTTALLHRVAAEISLLGGAVPGEFRRLLDGARGDGREAGGRVTLVSPESVPVTRDHLGSGPVPGSSDHPSAGPYRLLDRIGPGTGPRALGRWRARDEAGREVVVRYAGPVPSGAKAAARREAQAVLALRHPGIVTTHDFGWDDGVLYFVEEPVEGEPVGEPGRTRTGWPSPHFLASPASVADLVSVGRQVLDALRHAHQHEVTHRHLTAEEIVRLPDGRVKVGGFGPRNRAGSSPDPARQADPGGGAADDLLDLGRVLYELATGRVPFTPLRQYLPDPGDEQPVPPRRLRPDLPPHLETMILDLLATDPERRARGAAKLLAEPVLPRDAWQYSVLGPLRAVRGRQDGTPTDQAERSLLAHLLMSYGQSVPTAELAGALGDTERDSTPEEAVARAAAALRLQGHPVENTGTGHRLRLDTHELDIRAARQRATQAALAADFGYHETAAGLYDSALALWSGTPLNGVDGPWADGERDALREWRGSLENGRALALARVRPAGRLPWGRATGHAYGWSDRARRDLPRPLRTASTPPALPVPASPVPAPPLPGLRGRPSPAYGVGERPGPPSGRHAVHVIVHGGTTPGRKGRPRYRPGVRGALRRTVGRAARPDPDGTIRVTPGRKLTPARVVARLDSRFATRLRGPGGPLVVLVVHAGTARDETRAMARLPAPEGAVVVGLSAPLYDLAGSPPGYRRTEATENGTTTTVWYRKVGPASQAPRSPRTWLHRLLRR
ncbi:SAV_2336 family protein [Streptomyces sp. NBC_01317]|uniref:SAV_2336 N-terminal domain-related protein n=1 Tax=Streptomyces sp. NBC_01317 TaxID=2903822 RepID=UPI002E1532FB|nr:SAV_2336 family protein [Streptomyces sp. NBC_01317]